MCVVVWLCVYGCMLIAWLHNAAIRWHVVCVFVWCDGVTVNLCVWSVIVGVVSCGWLVGWFCVYGLVWDLLMDSITRGFINQLWA